MSKFIQIEDEDDLWVPTSAEIARDAPDGATHWYLDGNLLYIKFDGNDVYFWRNGWGWADGYYTPRAKPIKPLLKPKAKDLKWGVK